MRIALFFGSFNPVHIGHTAIANYIVEYGNVDKVWFIVSPQNPFKQRNTLLDEKHRYRLLQEAVGDDNRFFVSNIEFHLPKPSYTIDTLTYLKEKYPQHEFILIIGGDNLKGLKKWKNYEILVQNYEFIIYPRPNSNLENIEIKKYSVVNAPQMEISSSFIRQAIKEGKNIRFFMPAAAYEYLEEMNFYKN